MHWANDELFNGFSMQHSRHAVGEASNSNISQSFDIWRITMASQQLLLIALVVFIIGATIAVGMMFFNDQSTAASRDGLSSDLLKLSVRARAYYLRPKSWGGGEKSFEGLTIEYLTSRPRNANGTYSVVSTASDHVVLHAEGLVSGVDGNPLSMTLAVYADSTHLSIVNRSAGGPPREGIDGGS